MRLVTLDHDTIFQYQGRKYKIDSNGRFANRQIPIIDIETGYTTSILAKTDVEVITQEEPVEEVVEAEIVEESEEDNEDQGDWLEDIAEEV